MRRLHAAMLLSFCVGSGLAQEAAPKPNAKGTATAAESDAEFKKKIVIRSGEVVTCRVGKGCEEESINGRKFLAMETDGFVVKVALGFDRNFSHADVVIVNQTSSVVELLPADFRIEVGGAKGKRLSYVDPDKLETANAKPVKQEHASAGLPPPSYWTSANHARDKEVALARLTSRAVLRRSKLEPREAAYGRVYFDRPGSMDQMSLVVPVSGVLFAFPYNTPDSKDAKKNKKAAAEKDAGSLRASSEGERNSAAASTPQ